MMGVSVCSCCGWWNLSYVYICAVGGSVGACRYCGWWAWAYIDTKGVGVNVCRACGRVRYVNYTKV